MNLFKEFLQAELERLFLAALVEFAEEVAACAEGGIREGQGCVAEILC